MKFPVLGSLALLAAFIAPQAQKFLTPSHSPTSVKIKDDASENRAHFGLSRKNSGGGATASFSGNVLQEWVRYFGSGQAYGVDVATAIAADNNGYVYVTGYSSSPPFGLDYLTLKYHSPSGNLLWSARFSGEGYDNDIPVAIVVDGHGNVSVTGQKRSAVTGVDFATVNYDRNGVQRWAAYYDGILHADDYATLMAVDAAGNIYVSGYSYFSEKYYDCTTVKYDSLGAEQWVVHYRGAENSYNKPYGLALDSRDEGQFLYITGGSTIDDLSRYYDYSDFFMVKYDLSGQMLWSTRYDSANGDDVARDLAVSALGDVYVTGRSADYFMTIKYDSTGNMVWKTRHPAEGYPRGGAFALGLDANTNIYVTGGNIEESITVKYDSEGEQLWSSSYYAGSGGSGYYSSIIVGDFKVDPKGNTYIAGFWEESREWRDTYYYDLDYKIFSYDSFGDLQWHASYDDATNSSLAPAMAQDRSGNIFMAVSPRSQSSSYDYFTVKYNPFGVLQWAEGFQGPGNSSDTPVALAMDEQGDVHVTGTTFTEAASYSDIATVKYNKAGDEVWRESYDSGNRTLDAAQAIATDDSGNVYVVGRSSAISSPPDLITIKYHATGKRQWEVRHANTEQRDYDAYALAVDRSGYIYTAVSTPRQLTLLKYDASGRQQWVTQKDCPNNEIYHNLALAVDDSGNAYLARTCSGFNSYSDIVTFKFDSAGTQKWLTRYDASPANTYEEAIGLAVDSRGYVYVTGNQGGSRPDYLTIKYEANGKQQWAATFDGPGDEYGASRDEVAALAVDSAGDVYVTGTSTASESKQDYLTIKYDKDGAVLWTARYNGPQHSYDKATTLALDDDSNVYVTGYSYYSERDADFITIKYNTEGQEEWLARYHGQADSRDYAKYIALDAANNIFVLGRSQSGNYSANPYGASVYTTIKYSQSAPVIIQESKPASPVTYALSQNFPNPFNPSTTIRYSLAKESHVTLQIFDLVGREVATLVNEVKSSGAHKAHWNAAGLPSGIYLYRLQVSNSAANSKPVFIQTRKLILMK